MRPDILRSVLLATVLLMTGCEQAALVSPEPAPEAYAASQAQAVLVEEAAGDFIVVPQAPPSVTPDGDECRIELLAAFVLTGTLEGSFTALFEIEHEGPCGAPAPEEFEAKGTFEGAVNGASGTFALEFEGTISAEGRAEGVLEIEDGTGDLKGLEGSLILSGTAGVDGTYTGSLRFERD